MAQDAGDRQGLFEAIGSAIKRQGWGLGWASYWCARGSRGVVCLAGPPFKKTIGIGLDKGNLLWTLPFESPHVLFLDDAMYLIPRVGSPLGDCRRVDPLTGKVLDQFSLKGIGSCTRLTATADQFYYRPGGGQGRTVYIDRLARQLADYQGIVRPGCFDGVLPANGRLYWMPLACDCWQVHGTFSMAPRVPLKPGVGRKGTGTFYWPEGQKMSQSPAAWAAPVSTAPAAPDDWPMFRANAVGTATVPASVGQKARELWRRRLPTRPTAPISARGRVFVGGDDGTVRALDAANGKVLGNRRPVPPCSNHRSTGTVAWSSAPATASCTASMLPADGCWEVLNWRRRSGS